MASKPSKIGKVTFYSSTGAFVQDLSEEGAVQKQVKKVFSPTSQVFVPADVIENVKLEEGQLVEFEEEDNVATSLTLLSRK